MQDVHVIGQYAHLSTGDIGTFAQACLVTLSVTLLSLFLGTVIGTVLGIIRCSKNKVISALPLILIEPLRNSPLVVQLFLVYYGLPVAAHILLDPYPAAIITLSLNTAAFFAVLVHNSIKAVPNAMWEAGYALGHSKVSTFIYVIARQAIRLLLPQAITLYIGQLQCSSIVSLISMKDICRVGQIVSVRTMQPFVVWGIVFALYYVVSFPLARLAERLAKSIDYTY